MALVDSARHCGGQLEGRYGITARIITADLSDPGAPAAIDAQLAAEALEVDVLVNNAGYTRDGQYLSYPQHRVLSRSWLWLRPS